MLDPEAVRAVVGKRSEPEQIEYDWRDVVLYALGVGAQADELPFIYEKAPGGLKVIPSFGVTTVPPPWTVMPELDLDPWRTIHAGHCLRVHRPFEPAGKLLSVSEVVSIYDKRRGALITVLTKTSTETSELVCENEAVYFYVGGGGFGGEPGPKSERIVPCREVDPDFRIVYTIPENQAALYRLSGDYNPLHIDAELACQAGFDRPILHGLCSFGYATRAILYGVCGGDVSRFAEFKVRFSAPVFPGDTLATEGWKDETGRYVIQVSTERGVALSNAYTLVAEEA